MLDKFVWTFITGPNASRNTRCVDVLMIALGVLFGHWLAAEVLS